MALQYSADHQPTELHQLAHRMMHVVVNPARATRLSNRVTESALHMVSVLAAGDQI